MATSRVVQVLTLMYLANGLVAAPITAPTHARSFLTEGDKASSNTKAMAAIMGGPKVRGVQDQGKKASEKLGAKSAETDKGSAHLQCGVTTQVGSESSKYDKCPADCPYFAQNRKDTDHCTFLCVTGDECGTWNGNKPIPDVVKKSMTCRGPMVQFCTEANIDGTDSCAKCQSGFRLYEIDGQCYFEYWNTIIIGTSIILVIVLVLVVWVIDLCCRETINEEEVKKGQLWRSRSKNLMPKSISPSRHPWPLGTNMCAEPRVAGPGMLLHFNFQAFLIFWPLVVAIVWTVFACFHNELFILGTRKFGTPRMNCILVAWGYETQQRLMWTKVSFLAIVYVFSVISFFLFALRQQKIYAALDSATKSMKDYALELKGVPELTGTDVEKKLQSAVEAATKLKIVGISVAWQFHDKMEAIQGACRKDLEQREREYLKEVPIVDEPDPTADMGGIHQLMYKVEKSWLGPDDDGKEEDITAILRELKTSDSAFVVFNTEEDKEDALKVAQESGIKFENTNLTFEELECEPKTIRWENFEDSSPAYMTGKFFKGFFKMYVPALAIWFFAFYVPYALSLYNFNYDNGAELPGYYGLIFTMVVVGGNATMYIICDLVCEEIGFRYSDTKQCAYMLMYLFACMFNVLLDMVVTYFTALKIMTGLDFRTYHGTRLSEIHTFTEQFETYAMQRSLAENTYRYAFPSTFLVPFLLEPFVTIVFPYLVGKMIISKHREIRGACAEAYIAAFEFDLGRYADILLNVFLGILIFFFPGGYTWSLFYGMFISHIVIYLFDHYRVLHVIPSINIVSTQVDWYAQVTLGGCAALILSCLVFKMNCETYAGYCLQDLALVSVCTLAGVLHFIVHTLVLMYVVPMFAPKKEDEQRAAPADRETFKSLAQFQASTWFSVNPVHCLRSKFIHKHKPYCRFSSVGKEHLMEVNESIGCFFSDVPADGEDFSSAGFWRYLTGAVEEKEKK